MRDNADEERGRDRRREEEERRREGEREGETMKNKKQEAKTETGTQKECLHCSDDKTDGTRKYRLRRLTNAWESRLGVIS